MQMCKTHWIELQNALKERGLWGPNEPKSSDGTRPWKMDPQELQTESTYDPLLAANSLIWFQAEQKLGTYLTTGSYCPLCEAEKKIGQGQAKEWITNCADNVSENYHKSQLKE